VTAIIHGSASASPPQTPQIDEPAGTSDPVAGWEARVETARRLENLGQLAGGIAHDFNNLLAVILNYASFVTDDLAGATNDDWFEHVESARHDISQITLAGERAARLTRQLLAFARREIVQPRALDLNEVISALEEMLRRTIGEHVELHIALGDDIWPILADPGQLEQVLVNLVVNARDAMSATGTLTIETKNVTVDNEAIAGGSKARLGRNVRLRVSDTGVGMSTEVMERIFEPFFTTKGEEAGSGLGLSTVYGIVTQADGSIQIFSEPGAGTTFGITFPATSESNRVVDEPEPYERTPKGETVLVVEDEAALREVTRRILKRNGYRVITAANGEQALEIARDFKGEIHLLVTDVVMPQMLGKEAAEKLVLVKPEMKVLFMSGYAGPVLASQGRLDRGVALIEKPFSEGELITKAGLVLDGHFDGFNTIPRSSEVDGDVVATAARAHDESRTVPTNETRETS